MNYPVMRQVREQNNYYRLCRMFRSSDNAVLHSRRLQFDQLIRSPFRFILQKQTTEEKTHYFLYVDELPDDLSGDK